MGNRNNKLNDASFALGQFVGAGAVSESQARDMLEDVARQWNRDWPRCVKTIGNGLAAGMRLPREIPEPQHSAHVDTTQVLDVTRLIANAREKLRARNEVPLAVLHSMTEDEKEEYKLSSPSDLESLTHPGGLVEDLIDWIVSSAEQPSRPLALAAVLPLVATLMGARYSTGTRDTRPNLYTVALAESGFGKEHARSQIKRVFMPEVSHGLFDRYGGPARIMSASALREGLEYNHSLLCQIDEFGGFIRNITDRKAGGHQQAISTDLRDYYSASSTYFEGAAYRGSPAKRIYNPNLCIHGTSTPDQFWTALSSASAEDGLLPRLILFHVDGAKPEAVRPQRQVADVPALMLERLAAVAGIDVVAARTIGSVARDHGKAPTKSIEVPWDEGATSVFAAVKGHLDETEQLVAAEARPFIRRVIENMVKLALIVAVGTNHRAPLIDERIMDWAASLAWTCATTMITQVSERLADNQREANHKRIAGCIRDAAEKGITKGKLADRLKSIDARQRDEIIHDLILAGRVIEVTNKSGGRPSCRLHWC